MCGIAGFNWKDEKQIRRMTTDLAYRGPNAEGIFAKEGVSLGHNRLSVIDLSASANQPMTDAAGECSIVFNGEIYNFRELKRELASVYTFTTESDTEVLLAAYLAWGPAMVERLNGMFAFALWDARTKTLFCARDRMGVKPFYYYWDGTRFIFASELKAILVHDIPRKLNRAAFNQYFRLLYVPAPLTMIENVSVLPPSHTLTLTGRALRFAPYGTRSVGRTNLSYGDATSTLKEKVMGAVKRHLIADVPVGVYLSGGIDSSIVLAAMAKLRGNIKTFTVGFELGEGQEADKFNQDFELARRTSARFGTDHHEIVISPKDALDAFAETTVHNSDPVSNPTAIAMRLLAHFARSEVTVALTGNAGDELFGGYDRYRMALLSERFMRLPNAFRRLARFHSRTRKLEQGSAADLFAQFMFQKDDRVKRVLTPEVFMPSSATKDLMRERFFADTPRDWAGRFMEADQRTWLPDHFFTIADKMSMSTALEERVPFADVELLEFSRSLPTSYKVDLLRTKKILKDAFQSELPSFLFSQPKRGWFSPAAKWLRDPAFADFARNVLSSGYYAGTRDLFDWEGIRTMLEDHISKKEYNLNVLWATLVFQAWARAYHVAI